MNPDAPKIVVKISKRDGTANVAGKDFKGPACAAATAAIRNALGMNGDNAVETRLAEYDQLPDLEQTMDVTQGLG